MSRIPGWTNVSSPTLRLVLFAGVAVCALFAGPAWAGVIYVKADATGTKTGLSWTNAYTGLQAALAAAEWGDEIRVAKGTYKPTSGTDRNVSFLLVAGTGLYGGFAGTETERAQRNWKANATILSGDIGTEGYAWDNSFRVVVGAYLTVLDGFTITGGTGNGGGMYNENCSPTIANCTFTDNPATGSGGGIYNGSNCSPTVTNCTFSGNAAGKYDGGIIDRSGQGGGMYNEGGSPTVTNCTFSGNTARRGGGGGIYNGSNCSPTVTNCTFSGNTADYGGGMDNHGGSPTVTNCTFSGNTGGGMHNQGSSPTVTNCTFTSNTADGSGGGMYNNQSASTVANCTFSGNTTNGYGGGMYNYYSSLAVTNSTFSRNTAGTYGGGMYNTAGLPTVANCIFWDNTAPLGAEIYKYGGTPTFRHCDIRGSGGSGALWNPALGTDGGGNIMGDPRFVAPATPAGPDGLWRTSDDGLRLQSDSPCVGAALASAAPPTDILGITRGASADIGAYEYSSGGGFLTLTYNAGSGGTISGTTPQTVDYGGDGSEVTAVPNTGYHFVQWSDGVMTASRTDTNVTADITVTAIFAPPGPAAAKNWSLYE